jgi:hypothetical protein
MIQFTLFVLGFVLIVLSTYIMSLENHTDNGFEPEDDKIVNKEDSNAFPMLPPSVEEIQPERHQELKLGDAMKLDHLGPMIVTSEGQLRRIANWDKMSKAEQDVAWRRISARNKERIAALRAEDRLDNEANEEETLTSPEGNVGEL